MGEKKSNLSRSSLNFWFNLTLRMDDTCHVDDLLIKKVNISQDDP